MLSNTDKLFVNCQAFSSRVKAIGSFTHELLITAQIVSQDYSVAQGRKEERSKERKGRRKEEIKREKKRKNLKEAQVLCQMNFCISYKHFSNILQTFPKHKVSRTLCLLLTDRLYLEVGGLERSNQVSKDCYFCLSAQGIGNQVSQL